MAKNTKDIENMLDYLKLEVMGKSLNKKVRLPEYSAYRPTQLLREIVSDEHEHRDTMLMCKEASHLQSSKVLMLRLRISRRVMDVCIMITALHNFPRESLYLIGRM